MGRWCPRKRQRNISGRSHISETTENMICVLRIAGFWVTQHASEQRELKEVAWKFIVGRWGCGKTIRWGVLHYSGRWVIHLAFEDERLNTSDHMIKGCTTPVRYDWIDKTSNLWEGDVGDLLVCLEFHERTHVLRSSLAWSPLWSNDEMASQRGRVRLL